jgi:hypothetical protein
MHQRAMLVATLPARDRLDRADFVVRVHDRDDGHIGADRGAKALDGDDAIGGDGEDGQLEPAFAR